MGKCPGEVPHGEVPHGEVSHGEFASMAERHW
jgi:hypothetical protein